MKGGADVFKIHDYVSYSNNGVCVIDDIKNEIFNGVEKTYYVMRPIANQKLKIMIPVDNNCIRMRHLVDSTEATNILNSFNENDDLWISDKNQRNTLYQGLINNGDLFKIAKVVKTLKKREFSNAENDKTLSVADKNLLNSAEVILYSELATCLNKDYRIIMSHVNELLNRQRTNE